MAKRKTAGKSAKAGAAKREHGQTLRPAQAWRDLQGIRRPGTVTDLRLSHEGLKMIALAKLMEELGAKVVVE
jgi:hypothetical protein